MEEKTKSKKYRIIIRALLLCFAIFGALEFVLDVNMTNYLPAELVSLWSSSSSTMAHDDLPLHDPDEDPGPITRARFSARGTIVRGWPSRGGILIHDNCYAVELDFLGLDRFNVSDRSEDQTEEDAFCRRLQAIGGRWFESEAVYRRSDPRLFGEQGWNLWLGWPEEGGVWVLWLKDGEEAEKGVSRIRNAHTMAERCKAIEIVGGTYYDNYRQCESLRDLEL